LNAPAPVAGSGTRLGVHRSSRWSTRIELVVTDPSVIVAATRLLGVELDRVEIATSRFRADSDVRRLQREASTDSPTVVSPDLFEAIDVALRAAETTDGAVDPTVGTALCRLGYDRDFADVSPGVQGRTPEASAVPGWRSVTIDSAVRTVTLPTGTLLDLGATAKAWAADRAARSIAAHLGCGVLVSLGGDLAVRSAPVGGFVVGVADVCGDPDAPTAVTVTSGGLATSGIGNRHWMLGATPVHHLIDPATGLPAPTPWRTVTVAAASAVDANTASTASHVVGLDAPEWLAHRGLPARLVTHDGAVVRVAGWPADPPAGGDRT